MEIKDTLTKGCGFESGPHGFKPWSSQNNDFKIDRPYLLPPSLALGIISIGQGLVALSVWIM